MIETLHAILTNEKERPVQQVKAALIKNTNAGTPWFGKDVAKTNS